MSIAKPQPGPVGPQGPQGVPGPTGPPGMADDLTYPFEQVTPAAVWTATHNMGKVPSVTVIDSAGTEIEGDVTTNTTSMTVVEFVAPTSGFMYLN